jgi:PAS domain S-box-containing protein
VGVAGLLFTALLQLMMLGMTGRTAVIQQKNEELKASEERYYRLFNDSPLPMWLYDATTRRFLMVNDRAVSHYGWTREEFLGMALPGVLPPGERPAAYGEGAMGTGPERTIEGRHVQKDGSLMDVVVHSSPASYGGAKAFVEVIQDVTREKKDRERLLLADKEKQMAEASSKAKSEFLASMSHEIRTPMNAIIGMADLLLESPLNEEQVKYVKVFRNAGENLLHIINDILDFSKIEAGQVQFESIPFSLKDLIQGLVEIMRFKAAERNIALSYDLVGDMDDALVGDPTRLRQILLNLVGNALKFTYRGSVTITVERAGDGASDPESRSGDVDLIFAVKDTGIGIPADVVDRIFDKFTQADTSMTRKCGGTGLGLTISNQLVRLMKGRIWVESTEGEGSTFSFSVRLKKDDWGSLAEGQGKGLPDLPGTEAARADRPLDILIVEDNDDNRLLLLSHLKKLPHRVDVAVDGREAVEKVVAGKAYDIIFMDIQMPVMDGYAATRHIRSWERDHNRFPRSSWP